MLSQEVIIKDPAILEVLSQAREGDGVHIYLDVPLTAPGLRLGTTIRDTDKGDVKDITYTALLRARAKDAKFALRIVDDIAYYALEVGMDEQNFRPYFDRKDGGQKWSPNRFDHPDALRLEKGQLVCIQMAMANKKEFTATLNNITMPVLRFTLKDLNALWNNVQHHSANWNDMETLEHHFVYSRINEGLVPDPRTLVSFTTV
ncbi:uncharacterized protein LOC144147285 isoform X3 [Haemaphysalis longicornis]